MKPSHVVALSVLVASVFAWQGVAHADSQESTCVMKKDGDKVKDKSGPCTFGQRQGNVTIDLKNGDLVDLRPVGSGNQYKDQNGNKVSRSDSGSNQVTFRWDNGKRLIVTFDRDSGYSGGGGYNNGYNNSENEYQRGYNDGLHGNYDQDKHNQAYKDGYEAGEAARGSHQKHNGQNNGSLSNGDYGINRLDNGGFEVVWSQPFCVARYNKHGKPDNYTDGCTNQQRSRSDQVAQQQKH
ncbi:MAG: hypothetical protein U1F09_10065 [Steroidobacteraceae bacterium]